MREPDAAALYREYWQHTTPKVQEIYHLFLPIVERANRECRVIRKILAFRESVRTGSLLGIVGSHPRMRRKDEIAFRELSAYDDATLGRRGNVDHVLVRGQ